MESIERLEAFLAQKPNKLTRRESFVNVKKPVSPEFRVPTRVRRKRRNSLPGSMEFEAYKKEKFYKSVLCICYIATILWLFDCV